MTLNAPAAWLDDDTWAAAQHALPIVCADLVPFRRNPQGALEAGLILRHSPFGPRWCQLGGRVRIGETVRGALLRHLDETLSGVEVDLPHDPQPDYVMQWFPEPVPVERDGVVYGHDPRRHAVALAFAVEFAGTPRPVPGGEADAFAWFGLDELRHRADELWPGTLTLVTALERSAVTRCRRRARA